MFVLLLISRDSLSVDASLFYTCKHLLNTPLLDCYVYRSTLHAVLCILDDPMHACFILKVQENLPKGHLATLL